LHFYSFILKKQINKISVFYNGNYRDIIGVTYEQCLLKKLSCIS